MKRTMTAAIVAIAVLLIGDMVSSWATPDGHEPAEGQSSVTRGNDVAVRPISTHSTFEVQQLRDRIGKLEREVEMLSRKIDELQRRVNTPQLNRETATDELPPHAGAIIYDAT